MATVCGHGLSGGCHSVGMCIPLTGETFEQLAPESFFKALCLDRQMAVVMSGNKFGHYLVLLGCKCLWQAA